MARRWLAALAALTVLVLACKNPDAPGSTASPKPPVKGFPSSMLALGDSITAGYGSCFAPTPCPRNSWSTGDGPQVESHYRRILDANPAIKGHARNLAKPGATVDDLRRQATEAAKAPADYVTILIGANDACHNDMTPVDDFRASVDEALATLHDAMPKARILLVSIPNAYRVWELGRSNELAVKVWKSGICPNLLANSTSTAAADVARRTAFRDRIAAYNTQLRQACATYGPRCRFDNVASFAFALRNLSALDFFHPNATGQDALADETYPDSFSW